MGRWYNDSADTKKQQKSKLFLLKAKLLDMLPEYEKNAEDYLNKSVGLELFRLSSTLLMEIVGIHSGMCCGKRKTCRRLRKPLKWLCNM